MLQLKKAFTLSEVLIVIAVIGIISTLTVTNLYDSYKEEQTIAKLKKVKNDLAVSNQKALAKYGNYDLWDVSMTATQKADRVMEFLKTTKETSTNKFFPVSSYSNNANYNIYELTDGASVAVLPPTNATNYTYEYVIATEGKSGGVYSGTNVVLFRLILNGTTGDFYGYGRGSDVGTNNALNITSSNNYEKGTNWALHNNNLDYLKCSTQLNWANKTSCK